MVLPVGITTYFVVNLADGVTTHLLKDEVQSAIGGFMSEIHWIQ